MCERGGGVPWVLLAALLPVSALLFADYSLISRGLGTEIGGVAVFLLDAMTMLGHRELAIGLGP
jgi:hypothetical protein